MSAPASRPYTSLIAGVWLPETAAGSVVRENPGYAGSIAARWCLAKEDEARHAMTAAAAAFPAWAAVPLVERTRLLTQLLAMVETDAEIFAATITRENGKPLRDARAEIKSGLADARHALDEAARLGDRERATLADPAVQGELVLEPRGPCLLITPWNFPLATIIRKLVPALLYGNPAVVKPSELTPGPACKLFSLLAGLPFPPGVASLVLGSGAALGPVLAGHPALRALSFTGSTAAGMSLARLTAGREVQLQLEMGGKNSLLVLADADLSAAVEAALTGGFGCAGQWCTGTGRIIVEQAVHDEFTDRLADHAGKLRVGPGDRDDCDLGPVVTPERVRFAETAVTGAVAAGGRLRCGGKALPGGNFFTPAVLDRVTETMPVFTDELFVPVLPVCTARDATDAVRLANTGGYGLSASVFSRDLDRAAGLARQIEAGIVHVNLHTAYRTPALPVPGWRDSGRGAPECGRFNRDFYTHPRAVYLRRS